MSSELISIVVPVYNEERFVEPLLRKVVRLAGEQEILVIDDGSTDQTPAILARLAHTLPIRVMTHPANLGKGAAIQTGLKVARGTTIIIQDADLEYDPQDYPGLLRPVLQGRTSIVYGSRFLGPHRAIYFWHRLGNWVLANMVNLLFNASLSDVETGYKVFRRKVLDDISLRANGFDVEVEFTCKALKAGYMIVEVPIAYYGRTYAEGKKITWKDGLTALLTIIRCRLNLY